MKFEMPIAEIQRFDLKDVISASGEETGNTEESSTVSMEGTVVGSQGGICSGGLEDNYIMVHCA